MTAIWRFESITNPGRQHYVIEGDCRLPETWTSIPSVNGVFTSPPYANRRQDVYGAVEPAGYGTWFRPVQRLIGESLVGDGSFFLNIKSHSEGGKRSLYVMQLVLSLVRWGWDYIDELCWLRPGMPGRYVNKFKNGFEPIYHFAKTTRVRFRPENVLLGGQCSRVALNQYALPYTPGRDVGMGKHGINPGRNVRRPDGQALPSNVIRSLTGAHNRDQAGIPYGATFPVSLAEFFVRAYSDPGDTWLDPFCGTGTLIQAAERAGRIGYGIELNPAGIAATVSRLNRAGLKGELCPSPT